MVSKKPVKKPKERNPGKKHILWRASSQKLNRKINPNIQVNLVYSGRKIRIDRRMQNLLTDFLFSVQGLEYVSGKNNEIYLDRGKKSRVRKKDVEVETQLNNIIKGRSYFIRFLRRHKDLALTEKKDILIAISSFETELNIPLHLRFVPSDVSNLPFYLRKTYETILANRKLRRKNRKTVVTNVN